MNRLKNEKSEYLLQHADNPVDWYPWSKEAFDKAEKENKPIMLSIGYSACHWCHVMAHESFEDDGTAELMNANFINIKLDKEERPDLDKIYQMSQTIITGKTGGWPLTVFMTPEKFPFFAGTYFPDTERHGLPGFKDILLRVMDFYKNQRDDISKQNIQIKNIFETLNKTKETKNIVNEDLLSKVKSELISSIDRVHGGFGSAPKFPHVNNLDFLIKTAEKNDKETLELIELTLTRMTCAGIYDHLKGGFFRYSVDELWMIPHFEKMLYDNGPMIDILCNAYKITQNSLYLDKINQTCQWAIEEMQDKQGGFYSTIDADSEHTEGKFYIWTDEELKDILNTNELKLFKEIFVVYDKPNFEGKYHLHVTKTNQECYINNKNSADLICAKLLKIRNGRVRPATDKKILVSWNSLLMTGLINAYKITGNNNYYNSAKKCFDFIRNNMWVNNKLYACYHDKPYFNAYLDDYAFLSKACIEFLKIDWNEKDFSFLENLTDSLINNFQDKENGGFYYTSDTHEELIYRPKSYMDESLPSGNSIATEVLSELYELTGNSKYIEAVDKSISSAADSINRSKFSHCSLYLATPNTKISKKLIIIRCELEKIDEYKKNIYALNIMNDNIYFIANNESVTIKGIKEKINQGRFTAYVCQNNTCSEPIKDYESLSAVISI
ncbi:MAG: thioredoxin domain-containing protein [Gammaproteobacteria bacterium]|nr:thioredoxin domain-containing protein [Gammaproteobacteria bacterium]